MNLEPLRCRECQACVPLRDTDELGCPYCGARVVVPPDYRRLVTGRADDARVRREIEGRYRAATRPPSRTIDHAAVALVLLAPAVVAGLVTALGAGPPPVVALFSVVIVPALLPGTALWLWSAAAHATLVRFHAALVGAPPERAGGPPLCRNCHAALHVEPDAISATCDYCRADSLVTDLAAAVRHVDEALRRDLRTLAEAIAALAVRRRVLVVGAVAAAALLAALALAAAWVYGWAR